MSKRDIASDRKIVELFIDEVHWIGMCEEAAELKISPDHLFGALLEHWLVKRGRIVKGELRESPIKAEATLEPIREDESYFKTLQKDRELKASMTSQMTAATTDEDDLDSFYGDL